MNAVNAASAAQSAPSAQSAESAPSAEPLRLAVIVGSVREGRFAPVVSDWFAQESREHGGFEVDVIDLAEPANALPLAFPASEESMAPDVEQARSTLSRRLDAADAFVVVTPEYNHSYPASLKNTIDWFHAEWQAKPVGLITYGGMAGGQRAAEHLRQVFPELHAVTVRDTLSFAMAHNGFDDDGMPRDVEGARAAAKGMLAQLEWWGSALRNARKQSPYGAAA